jgi:tRNA G37 N-methylase Trm5
MSTSPSRFHIVLLSSLAVLAICAATSRWFTPSQLSQAGHRQPSYEWRTVDTLPQPLAQFNSVFWEPRDTDSLRKLIQDTDLRGKSVMEIGTGTGLVAISCLRAGAVGVVATDVNPAAIANSRYNAAIFGVADRLEARLVPLNDSTAFTVIRPDEQFDLIVSNPPWEDVRPKSIDEYALFDPGFQLLHSLLADGKKHLKTGGRLWLAYGCTEAIRQIETIAPKHGWRVNWLDERKLADLPPVFLPGLLLELTPE